MTAVSASAPLPGLHAKLIRLLGVWAIFFGVVISGYVRNEPAPYELYMAGLIGVWVLLGLRFTGTTAILLALFVVFNIGGLLSITQMSNPEGAPMYIAVSMFLALTSVFFAAVLERQPELYSPIFAAWILAGAGTAFLGIAGYFGVGGEMFTRYGRAMGGFEDPNVFGPYLVAPTMLLLYRVFTGNLVKTALAMPILLILVGGIFFSFSRGAWGVLLLSAVLMIVILLLQPTRGSTKVRIVVMSILAIALLTVALLVALQLPGVSEVFASRAQLEQSYDGGRFGRFGRHWIGYEWALSNPFGIGPLVFGKLLGEDTHNIWLKALMDYGWIGFASYMIMLMITLAGGFKLLLRDRPWQPYLIAAYVTFVSHVALGNIIDTDHWRHFYLLVGLIWGAIALEQRYQRNVRRTQPAWAEQPAFA